MLSTKWQLQQLQQQLETPLHINSTMPDRTIAFGTNLSNEKYNYLHTMPRYSFGAGMQKDRSRYHTQHLPHRILCSQALGTTQHN